MTRISTRDEVLVAFNLLGGSIFKKYLTENLPDLVLRF
jgi:hypothetical protein